MEAGLTLCFMKRNATVSTRIVKVGIHTVLTSARDVDGSQLYAPASLHAAIDLSVPNERDPGAVWTL